MLWRASQECGRGQVERLVRRPALGSQSSSKCPLRRWVEESLYRFPHFSFRVHLVVCDVQECCCPQCPTGKGRGPQGCRRAEDVESDASGYKGDPLPLRDRLRELQEIKHLRLVEDNRANDEVESPLA